MQAKLDSLQLKQQAVAQLAKSSYQQETLRPIVCLAFVFPLILAYELGTVILGRESLRSGVDQWISQFLNQLGFGQLVLLPMLTAAIMIVWHHHRGDHWRIRWSVLMGMSLEAIGLGLILFWAANAFHLFSHNNLVAAIPSSLSFCQPHQWCAKIMTYLGSGIYEELFFRLILLASMIYLMRQLTNRTAATIVGMLVVSLVFAALHYSLINPAGTEFELSSFFFRFVASIVFCVLFLFRGFGIAVGSHVAFDVLTQL